MGQRVSFPLPETTPHLIFSFQKVRTLNPKTELLSQPHRGAARFRGPSNNYRQRPSVSLPSSLNRGGDTPPPPDVRSEPLEPAAGAGKGKRREARTPWVSPLSLEAQQEQRSRAPPGPPR